MDKPYDEALAIIQGVTENQRQWIGERGASSRRVEEPSKYEVNIVDLILARFDVLNQRFDKLEKGNVNAIGATNAFCEVCGLQGHIAIDCQAGMPDGQEEQIENVATTHNFYDYPKKKLDPFSNTYNSG